MANNEERKQLLDSLMGQLSAEDRAKLENILADKAATQKILSTPQAQELLLKILGGK
jgi:hypothetical protein